MIEISWKIIEDLWKLSKILYIQRKTLQAITCHFKCKLKNKSNERIREKKYREWNDECATFCCTLPHISKQSGVCHTEWNMKKSAHHVGAKYLIFGIIFGWMFSGTNENKYSCIALSLFTWKTYVSKRSTI